MIGISIDRIMQKLDGYLDRDDFDAAEKHILYWLGEARGANEKRVEFAMTSELIGLYRKTLQKEKAIEACECGLTLVNEMKIDNNVGGATLFVNAATAYKCFGYWKKALELYNKAKNIYEAQLKEDDGRLGSLYNNMALALTDAQMFTEAKAMYEKAISVMSKNENGEIEQAITYLNLAELFEKEKGVEVAEKEISDCIEKAERLLDTESLPRDGYYAFVAEKCAPTFLYYGYFAYANELNERARKIKKGFDDERS